MRGKPKLSKQTSIEYRPNMNKDYLKIIEIPDRLKYIAKQYNFNKCALIVYHGVPVADERPRLGAGGKTFVPNAGLLRKIANNLLTVSEDARKTTITSFYSLACDFYMPITATVEKFISKHPKLQKLYDNDRLPCTTVKDVDNLLKSHNDIMFVYNTFIVLNDTFNVNIGISNKYYSKNPRSEVYILFSDRKPDKFTEWNITRSSSYFYYQLSYKYLLVNNMDYRYDKRKIINHLRSVINEKFEKVRNEKILKSVIGKIHKLFLESYSSEALKYLVNETDNHNFNKENAIHKLLLILFNKNECATKILNVISKFDELEITFDEDMIKNKKVTKKINSKPYNKLRCDLSKLSKGENLEWTTTNFMNLKF